MSRTPAIPPRIGTAPMVHDSKAKNAMASLGDFRSGGAGPARAPAVGGLPSRPPAGAGGSTTSPSPQPEAAPAAAAAAVTGGDCGCPYPEDCFYELADFVKLKQVEQPVPDLIVEFAGKLWKEMPENLSTLQNASLRDILFKDDTVSMPSKVLQDRKLHNEVLGILGKVTEQNLDRMKKELTDLPIRQSTEAEIHEVINTFFRKCVRPEDSRYTPLYVELIAHLINTIGENEPAGRMIRREVLFQCRDTFTNAKDDAKEMEERIVDMPEEEANLERMQFTGKQKANIYFLGLLFCKRIAGENVVVTVLENLLYGDLKKRRFVPDYCAVHFMELLQTCGPYLSHRMYDLALPRFFRTLADLQRTHPQKRIQILIENFLETASNNWVPLHGKGAVRQPQGARNNNSGSPSNPPPPPFNIIIPDPKLRVPDREEFWKVLDDYFTSGDVDEITAMLPSIPRETLLKYLSRWIGRYLTTYRYTQERGRLGEMFEVLAGKDAVPVEVAREALMDHVKQAIDEDLFTDQPKYFVHWAAVIKNGRSVFPTTLHTKLLDMLVDAHVSRRFIVKMIVDVTKALEEGTKPDQRDYVPQERFRVLQALLRYTPPLLASPEDADDDDDDGDDDEDLVAMVANKDVDVETTFFSALCDGYDDENGHSALLTATDILKKSHNAAFPLISAYFTFSRYDAETVGNLFRDAVKKICSVRPVANLLEEAYVQWLRLDTAESQYTQFVKKVLAIVGPGKIDHAEKLKERLRAAYKCETMIFILEKDLKQN